mmetsp:Transcript_28463/g.89722  ORF Transcript_28463/g.89722 Transcript_28463/m.89722 type:complete len:140 (-) Transcript_28463:125-544(-)
MLSGSTGVLVGLKLAATKPTFTAGAAGAATLADAIQNAKDMAEAAARDATLYESISKEVDASIAKEVEAAQAAVAPPPEVPPVGIVPPAMDTVGEVANEVDASISSTGFLMSLPDFAVEAWEFAKANFSCNMKRSRRCS